MPPRARARRAPAQNAQRAASAASQCLHRELGADFDPARFLHRVRWNAAHSRIEMHLESDGAQTVHLDGHAVHFAKGETIHTENSYKFTAEVVLTLLARADFTPALTLQDPAGFFAVTLAMAS